MDKSIFYSWQSDLPNNLNRGLIQTCIEKAVKTIRTANIHLEIAIDRDTKGVSGTPDIASTIFSKIDQANIFIADISFINSTSKDRKTPNPNVLIELGYASKTIGWQNIICIFNTEFGVVEDLPFDLRFRRPLTYDTKKVQSKAEVKAELTKTVTHAIARIIENETSKDEIRIYIKQQVDKEVLGICNHLSKLFFNYEKQFTLEGVWELLNFTSEDIQKHLFEREFLGFTILKDWQVYMQKLQETMNQPFFTQNAEPIYVSSLIKLIRGLEVMTTVTSDHKLFIDTNKKVDGYKTIDGNKENPDNPKDTYLLLKNISADKGIVIDFGTIKKYNVPRLLNLQRIKSERFFAFSKGIEELLKGIETWTKNTGNHLIIDPLTFRTHGR